MAEPITANAPEPNVTTSCTVCGHIAAHLAGSRIVGALPDRRCTGCGYCARKPEPACTFPGCAEHECQLCGRVRTHDAAVAEGPCDHAPEPAECPRHPGNDRDTCPPCSDRRRRWAPMTRCPLTFSRTLDEATVRCTRPAGHPGFCNAYGDPWDGPTETIARLSSR